MAHLNIWIHAVWTTKNRQPYLTKPNRKRVFTHMRECAFRQKILVDKVNGHNDHVHCLFRLRSNQTIEQVIKLIKGESSYWINKQQLTELPFKWQNKYWAVSLGKNEIKRVQNYIRFQEKHHEKKSFQEEISTLERKS